MSALDIMPLSTSAYLADTQHLTLHQHGAYMLILMSMWRFGGWIPDDERQLARLCKTSVLGWRKLAPAIRALLIERDGKLSQKRLLAEVDDALASHQKRVLAGSIGGRAKALKLQELEPSNATVLLESDESGPSIEEVSKKESKREGPPKRRRAHRIPMPEDWRPEDKGTAYASERGFEAFHIEQMIRACRDYHLKHGTLIAGEVGLAATWRTWVENEIKFSANRRVNGNGKTDESRSLIAAGRRLSEKLEHSRRSGDVGRAQERNGGARDAASDIDVRLLPER